MKRRFTQALCALVVGAFASAVGAQAQCQNDPPDAAGLGVADIGQASPCGQSSCRPFTVFSCSGANDPVDVNDVTGDIRITEPSGSAIGTILFLTGGRSVDYYADSEGFGAPAAAALTALRTAGYRTIEVKFDQLNTWSTAEVDQVDGVLNLACRGATLFQEIFDEIHGGTAGGPYCATGNSGGAALLAYTLSHYNLETIFDTVVFTSGPTMSRVDWGCLGNPPGNFEYECGNKIQIDQSFGFDANPNNPPPCNTPQVFDGRCAIEAQECDDAFGATSIMSTSYPPDYDFPIVTGFLFGDGDPSSAVDQGRLYCEKLEQVNGGDLHCDDLVPGADHGLPGTSSGANAVRTLLMNNC